jgi:Rrf2 family protein
MTELARRHEDAPVTLKVVADAQAIPKKYLYSVFESLKVAGLVSAARGVGGGYALAASPVEITVLDVVEAVEGPQVLVDCVESPGICERSGCCVTQELWQEMSEAVRRALSSTSLQDMAVRFSTAEQDGSTCPV